VAGAGTAVALLTIAALRPVRRAVRGLRTEQEELILEVDQEVPLDQLMKEMGAAGIRVDHLRVTEEGEDQTELSLSVRIPQESSPEELMVLIRAMRGVRAVEWSR
jgi:uncharacterized membrane protein YhiD involved in acid resistance